MKRLILFLCNLNLLLLGTIFTHAQLVDYIDYRNQLIYDIQEYVYALETFKEGDLDEVKNSMIRLNSSINRSGYREYGYFPILREKIQFYLTIINRYDDFNRIISSIGLAGQYTSESNYIEAFDLYNSLITDARDSNPFSDLQVYDLTITTNFEQDIIDKLDNEILNFSSLLNQDDNYNIKLCLIPFENDSDNINLNYLSQSLADSVGSLLENYQIFEAYSLAELGIESDYYRETLNNAILSNTITIIIKGQFSINASNELQVNFQAVDIQNDNLFVDVNIIGDTGLGIFSLIDNIGNKLAFFIETYNPSTFTDTAYISESESTAATPFSEEGYLPFLESKMNAVKEQGSIHYLNIALSYDNADGDDFIDVITFIYEQIGIINNQLSVSNADINAIAGELYEEINQHIKDIVMDECGLSVDEIEDYMENGNYRNGLRKLDNALARLTEINSTLHINRSFMQICRNVKVVYEMALDEIKRSLIRDWQSVSYGFKLDSGYPIFFGRTSFVEKADVSIPELNFGFAIRLPLGNFHIFLPLGIGISYIKTDLSASFMPDGYSLNTQFYLIEVSAGFLYEIFWNCFLGCIISAGMGFTSFENNMSAIDPSINSNEVVYPGNVSMSFLIEYSFIPELDIYLGAKTIGIFDSANIHLFVSPGIGIRYFFM